MRVNAYKLKLNAFLSAETALLLPTTPFPAPKIGADLSPDDFMNMITLTSIASLAGLPQVQMPIAQDENARPIGLSLVGQEGNDFVLINAATKIELLLKSKKDLSPSPF